jgi:hypothetical protein
MKKFHYDQIKAFKSIFFLQEKSLSIFYALILFNNIWYVSFRIEEGFFFVILVFRGNLIPQL